MLAMKLLLCQTINNFICTYSFRCHSHSTMHYCTCKVHNMSCYLLTIDSCVCGYHEYSGIWEPFIGEELQCDRETANPHDPYAVSVLKWRQIVGHVPRTISRACSVFLRNHGTIKCTVTGNHCL